MSRLNLSREEYIRRYRAGIAKGVVLAATNPYQTAADARFNGFYAGAFTYKLTRYLWQQTGTPESAIADVVPKIPKDFNQTPRYEIKVGSGYEKQPMYFINNPNPAADAVVTEVKGNEAKLWFGGVELGAMPKAVRFATIAPSTVFNALSGKGELTLRSREGLAGVATVEGAVQPGALLRKAG